MAEYKKRVKEVLIIFVMILIFSFFTGCGEINNEPVGVIPSTVMSVNPMIETDEHGLVWVVEPILEYERILYCVYHQSYNAYGPGVYGILNTKTGLITDDKDNFGHPCGGHGGTSFTFLFDEEKELFIRWITGDHEEELNIYSYDDFPSNQLNAFRKVNSEKIQELEYAPFGGKEYDFSQAYAGNKYALAFGVKYITDFIYDRAPWGYSGGQERGYAITLILDGKFGIFHKEGEPATPFIFDDIIIIDKDTAFVKYNGKYGILDYNK